MQLQHHCRQIWELLLWNDFRKSPPVWVDALCCWECVGGARVEVDQPDHDVERLHQSDNLGIFRLNQKWLGCQMLGNKSRVFVQLQEYAIPPPPLSSPRPSQKSGPPPFLMNHCLPDNQLWHWTAFSILGMFFRGGLHLLEKNWNSCLNLKSKPE